MNGRWLVFALAFLLLSALWVATHQRPASDLFVPAIPVPDDELLWLNPV